MSAKVQMLARWSELSIKADKIDPSEAELKRLFHGDSPEQNTYRTEVIHEYGPIVFEMNDVKRYNRAKEAGHTTVYFKDGDTLVLKIPYIDFMEIDIQYSGKQINDFIPADYIDPEDEEMDENTDLDLEL
jgi:hypothetical protein